MEQTIKARTILWLLDPLSFVTIIGIPEVETNPNDRPWHCGCVEDILDDTEAERWLDSEVLGLRIDCDGEQEVYVLHKEG